MDKLKPILAQKFWILAGLCLILPLAGWWVSTAGMAEEIKKRTETLETAYKSIPQPGPNKNWTDRVLALNKEEEQKVVQTGDYLWNNQLQWMTWPELVQPGIDKAGYRGEIDAKARQDYRYVYDQEILDTLNIVSPFNPIDGTGLVDAALELIPNNGWGMAPAPPSSIEMWDSQEDLWLYRALFQAVANINLQFDSNSIVDSKIKQIVVLELRGGTVGGGLTSASSGGAMPGGSTPPGSLPGGPAMPGGASMPPGMNNPMGGKAGGLGGLGGLGDDTLSATFDPSEQFGSDADTAAATSGAASTPPPAGGQIAAGAPPAGPGGPMGQMGMMGGNNAPRKRYIEITDRYKTRGFYMEVIMDHRQLPEFISELSDSGWPLRVIRVQAVDRDLADIDAGGVVGMGASGMGTGAMPANMKGMMGAMPRTGSRSPMADEDDASSRRPPARLANPMGPKGPMGGGIDGGFSGDGAVDLQVALSDPYLVNVALSGIITLYLPPPVAGAQPGTPGAPATPSTTIPATGTPPATATNGTTPAAETTPPATAAPATTGDLPAKPAAEKTADTPAPAEPNADKPATATPGTPPAGTPPAPGSTPPAPAADPTTPPPAKTPEKAAGTR